MASWTVEQSWLMALLPLLLLYNDPAFPLSLLLRHWSAAVVDVTFQTCFLSALLLFWLCSAHCLLLEPPRHRLTFYMPKVLIIGPLWALALTLGIWKMYVAFFISCVIIPDNCYCDNRCHTYHHTPTWYSCISHSHLHYYPCYVSSSLCYPLFPNLDDSLHNLFYFS
uniref:Wntless-like transmembrane domain-containing protein n=1 Tax=Eptatretus burgeri TaxID=7764 RepID=A0A8C4NB13_EPTBU